MPKIPERISNEMKDFLTAWLNWADNGAEDTKVFRRDWGLCDSLGDCSKLGAILEGELDLLFDDEAYPFGERSYDIARKTRTMHLDENRLNWVRETLMKARVSPMGDRREVNKIS